MLALEPTIAAEITPTVNVQKMKVHYLKELIPWEICLHTKVIPIPTNFTLPRVIICAEDLIFSFTEVTANRGIHLLDASLSKASLLDI